MGWLIPSSANGLATGIGSASNNFVNLPSAIKDGDEVWVALFSDTWDGVTVGGAPAGQGWSVVGSQFTNAGWTGLALQVFRKTWHTGDPTTNLVFTSPGGAGNAASYIAWIVRSDTASPPLTVHSDHTAVNAAGGATTLPAASAVNTGDFRMLFMLANNSQAVTFPSPAITDENPVQVKPQLAFDSSFNGIATWLFSLYIGIWRDDSLDAGTESITFSVGAPAQVAQRFITLTDGTTHNGGGSADEEGLFQCTADPTGYTPEQAGQDQDSASANWWGGGTNTLGDHD